MLKKNIDGKHCSVELQLLKSTHRIRLNRVIKSENALFDGNSLDMSGSEIFSIDGSSFFDTVFL